MRAQRSTIATPAWLGLAAGVVLLTMLTPWVSPAHRCWSWIGVVLASFVGWGAVVNRLAFPAHRADLGLRCAWGMALVAAVGGLACLVSFATREFLLALILAGIGCACVDLARGARDPQRRFSAARGLAPLAVAIPAMLHVYGGLMGVGLSPADDYPSYLVFPRKILDTGTLVEPFSMHRMAAYGGQSLFQALTLLGALSPRQVQVFDMGIGSIVLLALIIGDRNGRAWTWLLPVALVLTLPLIWLNSASHMSGAVFAIALYRTATWSGFDRQSRSAALVIGLVAAAAATLRHSYLVPAVLFPAALYVPAVREAWRAAPGGRWPALRPPIAAMTALALCLLPWMLLSFRSNETVLYPLFRGTYRAEYGDLTRANPLQSQAMWFWTNLNVRTPVYAIEAFVAAALLIPWRLTRGALPALTIAAIAGFCAIVYGFPLATAVHVARYHFAFTFALIVAVAMAAFSSPAFAPDRGARRLRAARLLVVLGSVLQLWVMRPAYMGKYQGFLLQTRKPIESSRPIDRVRAYAALQTAVPAGAGIAAMLDEPYWLDFRRNPISILDLPGQSSPAPGLPVADDQALVRYLWQHNFRYLAFVRPEASLELYKPRTWRRNLDLAGLADPKNPIWDLAPARFLQFFDRLDVLLRTRPRTYDDGTMVVVELSPPAAAPSVDQRWW